MPYCPKCGNEISSEAKFCPKCGAAISASGTTQPEYTSPNATAPTSAQPPKLAFLGERFLAWLIDAVIIGLIVGFLGLFSLLAIGQFTWWGNWPYWVPFFNFNVGGVIYFLYWFLMDGAYGQSIGKMVMHLKVVSTHGKRINVGQAAIESVGKAFILPVDIIIGWILYPKSRQRLFNYISETVVVRDRP